MATPAAVKIRADKFSFFYGDFQALHDITLDIHQHRVTALIGPIRLLANRRFCDR